MDRIENRIEIRIEIILSYYMFNYYLFILFLSRYKYMYITFILDIIYSWWIFLRFFFLIFFFHFPALLYNLTNLNFHISYSFSHLSKPLSRSAPSMAAGGVVQAPGNVNRSSSTSSPTTTSSARQKKFHRHFSQVKYIKSFTCLFERFHFHNVTFMN